MKNKHSEQPEPDMITIFIGTWNMGNAPPPKEITSWFLSKGQGKTRDDSADYIPHDIYVIGTQEDPLGEKEWLEILKHSLQEITSMTFKTIAIHTLWNIRIVVLAKPEHENRISHICTDNVKTGIANTLGERGGRLPTGAGPGIVGPPSLSALRVYTRAPGDLAELGRSPTFCVSTELPGGVSLAGPQTPP